MTDVIPSFDEQTYDRDGVGHIQQHDAGRHHAIESRVAANVKQAEEYDKDVGYDMSGDRHIHTAVDMG